ncbi:MAG: hypothetical protein ACI4IL_07675 [Eubacterium sp.]
MKVDTNSMDNEKDNSFIRNLIVASVNFIPNVGGVVSLFLDKYLPDILQERQNQFLNNLAMDLKMLPNEIIQKILISEDYHSLLLKTFASILQEDRNERIAVFRNILINAAIDKNPDYNEFDFYYKLLNELVSDQIKILHLFYLRDCKKTIHFTDIYNYIGENWKNYDKSYCAVLIPEIMRYGLITNSIESKREFGNGYHLTMFGRRFINFIFSPIELY